MYIHYLFTFTFYTRKRYIIIKGTFSNLSIPRGTILAKAQFPISGVILQPSIEVIIT